MHYGKVVKSSLAALLAVSMAACASEPSSSDGGSSAADSGYEGEGSVTEYKLGFVGPLTGDLSVYGTAVRNGEKLALEKFNKENGTNITLVEYDSKGDSTEAVSDYQKLVTEDKVAAIMGGVVSGESTAIGTASQETGIPVMTPSGTASAVTLTGPNVFRACYTDPYQAKVAADFAYDTLGATKAAILYDTTADYNTGLTESFTEEFEKKGGTIVDKEGYSAGDTDFNTQLTKIKAAEPDVFFVPNYYADDALIASQAKAQGITAPMLGGDGWDGVLDVVGDDASAVEGAIFVNHYSPDDEQVKNVIADYKAEFNSDPNAFAILAYDATLLMCEAISSTGSLKAADIVKTIQGIDFKDGVLSSSYTFDSNGDPIKDLAYVTIKNGEYHTYSK